MKPNPRIQSFFSPGFQRSVRAEVNLTGDRNPAKYDTRCVAGHRCHINPELNKRLRRHAREHIWCNVAAGKQGDVVLPQRYREPVCHRSQHLRLGPGCITLVREEIEKTFPDLDDLILLGEWIRDTYRGDRTGTDSYDTVLYAALRDPETRKSLASGMNAAQEYVQRRFAL